MGAVIEDFRRRRNREALAACLLAVAVAGAAVVSYFDVGRRMAWIFAMAVAIIAYAAFHAMNWRCPACGCYLANRSIWFTPRCDACGAAFTPRAAAHR